MLKIKFCSNLLLASPGRQIIPFHFAIPLPAFTTASNGAYFQKYCNSYFLKKYVYLFMYLVQNTPPSKAKVEQKAVRQMWQNSC